MRDQAGSLDYQYNSLSHLISETRQFTGPFSGASYSLNYQYNLGGQLKKITDHTNTTINYNSDGKIFKVGNFNRGIINRDLPNNCR